MRATTKPLVKAICLSVALLGATAVVSTLMVPDMAFAKSDKAKDRGDKGKPEKSKGKEKNKSKDKKSSGNKPESKGEKAGKKPYQGGNAIAVALGVHPSELGNLNAWNGKGGDESEGMPGRLAAYEDFVVWSNAMGGATGDIDAAKSLFGDPTCDAVTPTDCYYDPLVLFPLGIPAEGDAGYDDYLLMVAANDAYDFVATSGDAYEEFGEVAEMDALQEIANKDIGDDLFDSIRAWILATAEAEAAAADDSSDSDEGEGDD